MDMKPYFDNNWKDHESYQYQSDVKVSLINMSVFKKLRFDYVWKLIASVHAHALPGEEFRKCDITTK